MKVKLPLINTSVESEIGAVFLLTPVWWLLGLNVLVYHFIALSVCFRLFIRSMKTESPLHFPRGFYPFLMLLFFYLASIVMNAPLRPAQRILASINNYSMLVMGAALMFAIYNSRVSPMLTWVLKSCRILCLVTGCLAVLSLALWLRGYENLSQKPLLMKFIPSLENYPYFNSLMIMRLTNTEWLFGETPRLSLYSGAPTATGGLLLLILPFAMAYYTLERRKLGEYTAVLILCLFALLYAQSRSALCGGLAAFLFVQMMGWRHKLLVGFTGFMLALASFNFIYQGVAWLLDIRQASNVGRFSLYQEALEIVWEENILMGLGARLRDDFTLAAIGSHACYIELIFVSGIAGLVLFIGFQAAAAYEWLKQQKLLKNTTEKTIWKYSGLAFWGTNLWLVTDTILAYPYIAYAYFLMTGFIFLFGRALRRKDVFDWRNGQLEVSGPVS